MHLRLRCKAGFSLAEVALAIAVVSYALLAMVGLLYVCLKSTQESREDTSLALCLETTTSLLRSQTFSNASASTSYAPADTTPDFYFDSNGSLLRDANGLPIKTVNSQALYSCTITRRTPALSQPTTHLMYLQIKFEWPLNAPAANRQQRVVLSSLANCH